MKQKNQENEKNVNEKHKETHNKKENEANKIIQERDTLKDTLQRLQAEFQNYQKRTQDEKTRFANLANEELIKKLIPVLDNFELALKHSKKETEFVEGMELIYSQLLEILEQEGLQKIDTTGKFDPHKHEAIMVEETENEGGQILQELQKGYMLNDKIVRTSKVKISKKKLGGK